MRRSIFGILVFFLSIRAISSKITIMLKSPIGVGIF